MWCNKKDWSYIGDLLWEWELSTRMKIMHKDKQPPLKVVGKGVFIFGEPTPIVGLIGRRLDIWLGYHRGLIESQGENIIS